MPRKPKPNSLRLLDGSAAQNPQRLNANEPAPDGKPGDPPESLDTDQRQAWLDVTAAAWWATASDRPALELLAKALGDSRRLRRELAEEPATIQGSRGQVMNPKARLIEKSEDRAVRLLAAFGLTPADRSRVNAPRKPAYRKGAELVD